MWNYVPHTHAATSQLVTHSPLLTVSQISLTACGCGPEFSMRFDAEKSLSQRFEMSSVSAALMILKKRKLRDVDFPRCLALIASFSCTCSV